MTDEGQLKNLNYPPEFSHGNIHFVRNNDSLQTVLENIKNNQTVILIDEIYNITSPLILNNKQNVNIMSFGKSIINLNGIGDVLTLNNCFGITLQNLQLQTPTGDNGGHGLVLKDSLRTMMVNSLVYNVSKYCLYTTGSYWFSSKDCIFDKGNTPDFGCVYHGENSQNVLHSHSRFVSKSVNSNITLNGGYEITIENCDISGSNRNLGISVNRTSATKIINNYFECNFKGIQIGNDIYTVSVLIHGNYFNLQGKDGTVGIELINAGFVSIEGNNMIGDSKKHRSTGININDSPTNKNINISSDNYFYEITNNIVNPNHNASYNPRKEMYGTSAPTKKMWITGDKVWNDNPQEIGNAGNRYIVIGWVCVGSGTPGLWKEMRTLTGD